MWENVDEDEYFVSFELDVTNTGKEPRKVTSHDLIPIGDSDVIPIHNSDEIGGKNRLLILFPFLDFCINI